MMNSSIVLVTDYGRPARKKPSLHGRKFTPTPKFLGTAEAYSLVTQPMLQLRRNCTPLRSMDYYHQIFCRFQKRKRKVPPPSLLSNDFEKS